MADEHLLGREYVLHEEIGRGAMAVVYRATSRLGGATLAAKVLHPEFATSRRVRDLFLHEEVVLRDLDHESVVRVVDFVVERGHMALLTEYVNGPNLRRHLADRDGALPLADAVGIATQLGAALAYTHARGVLHLDIKPENILVVAGSDPTAVKLADFGLAGILHEAHVAAVGGTPGYTAPELARHEPATAAVDIYALGVLITEMIRGARPSPGAFDLSVVPPYLQEILADCLNDDPRQRPSARSLAVRLRELALTADTAGAVRAADPNGSVSQLETVLRRPVPPPKTSPRKARSGRRWRVPLMVAGAAALAGVVLASLDIARATDHAPHSSVTQPLSVVTGPATSAAGPPTIATEIPARQTYAAHLAGSAGTLYIAVRDGVAIAYLCDGKTLEAWFKGSAAAGQLQLTTTNGGSLTGTYTNDTAQGVATAADRTVAFNLPAVRPPSGLFKSLAKVNGARVKGGWIVLADGRQVGVLTVNDVPRPAPVLDTTTGTASVDGVTVVATEVDTASGAGF